MRTHLLIFFSLLFILSSTVAQNNAPTAVNDSAITFRGHVKINVLQNDYDIDGDNIWVFSICQAPKHGFAKKINDSIIEYRSFLSFAGGIDSFAYKIKDSGSPFMFDTAIVFLTVDNSLTADSVNINNINAGIFSDGNLFFKYIDNFYQENVFEVPKGSGRSTMFSSNIWIGGKDNLDTLHFAGQKYGMGNDFWAGPISNVYDSLYDFQWNRIWKMTKSEIDYHMAHCWTGGYVPAQSLIDWPGNGNTALGQAKLLAPFYDWNNDSIYDPYAGDYPLIKGDEALFFIFNDDRYPHTESGGNKLGVEIHGMAYEFDCPQDSAFWNTLFINYKIYNRSANQYHSTMVGIFSDFDIGFAYDDYVGCDVERSSFYGYNGKVRDGNGEAFAYDYFPPAQSVTFLAGPYMDADGFDNSNGFCDEGINGINFGNGNIDDERFGLSMFSYRTGVTLDANDLYNLMNGMLSDTIPMTWGGNATPASGSCGPPCRYMFPGTSDTCHWGTNGLMPLCDTLWTETTVGNVPYDRRGYGSSGPFTLEPGGSNELDLAFVFGRNYTDSSNFASIAVMQQRIDSIRKAFKNDSTPCGGGFSGVAQIKNNPLQLNIYPNPATDKITIETKNARAQSYVLSIKNIQGQEMLYKKINFTNTFAFDVSGLSNGIYILSLQNEKENFVGKIVVQK